MTAKKSKAKNGRTLIGSQRPMYVMLSPFLILFFIFTVLPIITSIIISFTSFDLISFPKFSGIDNYRRMLADDTVFPVVVKNTLVFAVIAGPLGFLLSFLLAWFVNEFSPRVRTLLSFLFYAPSLVGNAYFIWKVAFSGDSYGYINSLLLSLGIITEPIIWLKNATYLMPIIIMVQLWQSIGISFLSNISGLQNLNAELYEAGAIDGIRNRWQELRFITLPAMHHMLLFSAVMQIASAYSISGIIQQLAGYPTVKYAADTLVSYLQDVGTVKYEKGYAAALSVILFLMMVATRGIANALINKTGR